jgi:hypothetical protein
VGNRIQGEAAHSRGGRIAQVVCHPAMRHLMKHDRQQYRQGPDRNLSYGFFQSPMSFEK